MTRDEAIRFAYQLGDAVTSHDTDWLINCYGDDAVMVSPMFGEIRGREAIGQNWKQIFTLFPDWSVEITSVMVDGDRMAFLGMASATDRNGWFGEPATGGRISYQAVIMLTMRGGKIARDERIYDLSSLLQRLEKARLDKELQMASDVQRALLSRTSLRTSFCEAAADSLPCRAIGGDFFELMELAGGSVGIALGDVAGKGPASAILAAMIQGMLAAEVQNESTPAAIVTRMNALVAKRHIEPRFATFFFGVLAPGGELSYCNAGHNPPMLFTDGEVQRLGATGPVLGAFADSEFENDCVRLAPGATLVLFSDGVTEATNSRSEEFGEERLAACAHAHRNAQPAAFVRNILADAQQFCSGAPQADDITAAVMRFR